MRKIAFYNFVWMARSKKKMSGNDATIYDKTEAISKLSRRGWVQKRLSGSGPKKAFGVGAKKGFMPPVLYCHIS